MEAENLEFFGLRNPLFWDAPDTATVQEHWSPPRPVPIGWVEGFGGPWRQLRPKGQTLPPQGWKLHLSATLGNAAQILDHVWETCVPEQVAFKYVPNPSILRAFNAKYADRASSGKFITIYPRDDRTFEQLAEELCERLAGFEGPYILSDLRLGDAPVFARYGGFVSRRRLRENGNPEYLIARPDGSDEPDVRAPRFEPPAWAAIPPMVAHVIGQVDSQDTQLPVAISGALHFSNGGGVYEGRTADGVDCIVKEARPHAGLDARGEDAVSRLRCERDTLRELADVPEVPAVLDSFKVWEHEFVVLERRRGKPFDVWMAEMGAFLLPAQPQSAIDSYADRALAIHRRLTKVVEALHARGIVHNDLHPRNVMIDDDDERVSLLDFEGAAAVGQPQRQRIATPGFRAPDHLRGTDIDVWALQMMKLWLFCPLVSLVELSSTKIDAMASFGGTLLSAERAAELEAAAAWLNERKGSKGSIRPGPAADAATAAGGADRRAGLLDGIDAHAAPDDDVRLVPGDPEQFDDQMATLAHGAAGVLYALHAIGERRPAFEEWLLRQAATKPPLRVGAFDGRYGIAYVLGLLGYHEAALSLAAGARDDAGVVETPNLYSGATGTALCSLSLAHLTGHEALLDHALDWGERVAARLRALPADGRDPYLAPRPGLVYGWSGPAVLFHELWRSTGDDAWLGLAVTAVRQDLARCEERDGALFVWDDFDRRICYVAVGSAGVALATARVAASANDAELTDALPGLLLACAPPFVLLPGLLNGRAGLAATLAHVGGQDPVFRSMVDEHLDRLSLHLVEMESGIGVPGDQLQRLSMDLAAGSAGLLLASAVAEDPSICPIPLLDVVGGAHVVAASGRGADLAREVIV